MKNKLGKEETLCWSCSKAVKKCPWSINFTPVEGWEAIPTKLKAGAGEEYRDRYIDSFFVKDCPLFEPDPPRGRPAPKREAKPKIRPAPKRGAWDHWTVGEVFRAEAMLRKGYTCEEIGERLGRTAGSVKMKMLRERDRGPTEDERI